MTHLAYGAPRVLIGYLLRRAALPALLAMQVLALAQPAAPVNTAAPAQLTEAASPAGSALAPTAPVPAPAAAHPVDGPSFAPMGVALLVVLALMVAVLWVLRRVGLAPRAGNAKLLRIVSQLSLGPRERVVIVEAGDRWLLLGVGTGGISRLGSLPKGESAGAPAAPAAFGTLLEKLRKGSAQ
jgi:flagellar protein FliO/FliZ